MYSNASEEYYSCTLQRTKGLRYRFSLLIQELKGAETDEYCACVLALVNCILAACDDLSKRIKLRNEFIGTSKP